MSDQINQRILRGRPYGGTGFLFKKDLSNSLRARTDLKHNRVTVLELNTKQENILLINAYLPYFNPNNVIIAFLWLFINNVPVIIFLII